MKWYEDYDFIFRQFAKGNRRVDETVFRFASDPEGIVRYIGYLPEYGEPYWAGLCDVPDGCGFRTAKELFEAKIYDGRSIKDRWDEVALLEMGGVGIDYMDKSWF